MCNYGEKSNEDRPPVMFDPSSYEEIPRQVDDSSSDESEISHQRSWVDGRPRDVGCILKGGSSEVAVIAAVGQALIKAGWRRLKVTVDSGAAGSVIHPDEEPEYPRVQHLEPIFYQTASGEPLENNGEQIWS